MLNKVTLNEKLLNYAVIGGTILGGGGGGAKEPGLVAGKVALDYGAPVLVNIQDIPDDTIILTASAVGAPAAPDKYVTPKDYVRAIKILEDNTGIKVGGIITNENGGSATVNGWIQAAVLNIPVIDAPCNGRAHPTGTMGSMGLNNLNGYVTYQSAVGGNPALGNYVEAFFKGSIENTAKLVRQTSVVAGGLVAVARNPVSASYVKENGAINGVSHAIEVGRVFYEGLEKSPEVAVENVCNFLNGTVVVQGRVDELGLTTTGGFDVGKVVIGSYDLTFWNEYMTLERGSERIATFPDLIMTFDRESGMPVTSAEICKGQEVIVIQTNQSNLRLGSGMRDLNLMTEIEPIVGKEILKYL